MKANISSTKKVNGEVESVNVVEGATSSDNEVVGAVSSKAVIEGGVAARRGINGASAYEIAVRHGYDGTETEWVQSHFGRNGLTPYIKDGIWWVGNECTGIIAGVKVEGEDGYLPHIKDGNWWIGDTDLKVKAIPENGKTPEIGEDGYWYIDGVKQQYRAEGITPAISDDGFWIVNGVKTKYKVAGAIPTMTEIDEAEKTKNTAASLMYNEDFLIGNTGKEIKGLNQRHRVYVARSDAEGGDVSPYYPLEENASIVFSPYGYGSYDEMVNAKGWSEKEITEGEHYQIVVHENGKTGYHPRLNTVVIRTIDGNVRTGDPADSTDAVPWFKMKLNGTAKATVGRITEGRNFGEGTTVLDILKAMLFPYDPLSFSEFKITTGKGETIFSSNDSSPKTYAIGTEVKLTHAKVVYDLGDAPIQRIQIGTTEGGNDLHDKTAIASSGSGFAITNPPTFSGTKEETITLYCTLKTREDTTTKSAKFQFTQYNASVLTQAEGVPTNASNCTVDYLYPNLYPSIQDKSVTNSYVWFLMKDAPTDGEIYGIWRTDSTGGLSVCCETTEPQTVDFTTATGGVLTYYAYGTTKQQSSKNATFSLLTQDPNTYPNYVVLTKATGTPADLTSATAVSSIAEVTVSPSSEYVWFFTKEAQSDASIWGYEDNCWKKQATTSVAQAEYKTIANTNIKYYAYGTSALQSGTKYKLSATDSNTYANYYIMASDSDSTTDMSSATSIASLGSANITADNKYVWFLSKSAITGYTIWQKVDGWWKPLDTTEVGKVKFTTIANTEKEYYAFRTANKVSVDNAELQLCLNEPNTYYNYCTVMNSTTVPEDISSAECIQNKTEVTITTEYKDCVWFFIKQYGEYKIWQYSNTFGWLNASANVDGDDKQIAYVGETKFITPTGEAVTYYAYRTGMLQASTEKYRISITKPN